MTLVSIRVLEGMERGAVFTDIPLPVTMGREEDNTIQLNDDRVSRFHAKLQDQSGRVILTDLESTNGTRVNGHPIQMRVMRRGDVVTIGRCVLLFSGCSSDDADNDLDFELDPNPTAIGGEGTEEDSSSDSDSDIELVEPIPGYMTEPGVLFPQGRPDVPEGLNTLQRVQTSDLLSYIHEQLGNVVKASVEDLHSQQSHQIRCDRKTWMQLSALQANVAEYLKRINNPGS